MSGTEHPYQKLRITAIKEEAEGVKTFVLEPILPYKAGQFLTFVIHHHGKEERRSFSISTSPGSGESMDITIKRVSNGVYSRLLIDKATVGDELITTGAAGLFTIPANISQYKQVFLFAAGIGITPIFSLLKTLLITRPALNIVLVYSNSSKANTVFHDELNVLSEQYLNRFRIEFLFSNAFNLSRARLNKQLLPLLVDEYAITTKENMLFFTCGPFSYMRMVCMALEENGIKDEQVKKENFNTERKPLFKAIPPDTTLHYAIIKNDIEKKFAVQYPETILQAARKNGVYLPYSCETGRCGSCAIKCVEGRVWMSNNEVLTNSDMSNGMVLTCVGYPVNGDIVLKIDENF